MHGEENLSFMDSILGADIRFLQERDLGLDLYNSGFYGIGVFCLAVASATVFLLAIFHLLPSRKHIVILLLGLGGAAAVLGLLGAYIHHSQLPEIEASVLGEAAEVGRLTADQKAAVLAVPLLLGAATLVLNVLGCAYLAVFWSSSLLPGQKKHRKK
jgi:hypothetical protein